MQTIDFTQEMMMHIGKNVLKQTQTMIDGSKLKVRINLFCLISMQESERRVDDDDKQYKKPHYGTTTRENVTLWTCVYS